MSLFLRFLLMPIHLYIYIYVFPFFFSKLRPCHHAGCSFPLKHSDILFTCNFALSLVVVHASSILWLAAKSWSSRACWFSGHFRQHSSVFVTSLFPIDAGLNRIRCSNNPFYYKDCFSMNLISGNTCITPQRNSIFGNFSVNRTF